MALSGVRKIQRTRSRPVMNVPASVSMRRRAMRFGVRALEDLHVAHRPDGRAPRRQGIGKRG
jgi:hypothetical protein